jgi:hypothetical protein
VSIVGESLLSGGQALIARLASLPGSEYDFLVSRFVDRATLARATALARRWGVHPHEVMIANGWLDAGDNYRALAERCGARYRATLSSGEMMAPGAASPRQCLAQGLLKERRRAAGLRVRAGAAQTECAARGACALVVL